MSAPLSDEWFAAANSALAALPSAGEVDAVVQWAVSASPEGKVTFHAVIEDGVISALAMGKASDATAAVSCSFDTFEALLAGDLSPDAAFMDASIKVEGDHKVWLLDLRGVRGAALAALAEL